MFRRSRRGVILNMESYNTNLASEFYVLSMLHRQNIEANLTLGNKKSVDIVIEQDGKVITVDVKGIKESSGSFPMDNFIEKDNHFYVLVAFSKYLDQQPEVFIIPSIDIDKNFTELEGYKTCKGKLLYRNPKNTRKLIDLNRIRKLGKYYQKMRWEFIWPSQINT